jgi:pentatricopeptide repeat protein
MEMIKLPYAEYLCKNDRYEDALKVYKNMNR